MSTEDSRPGFFSRAGTGAKNYALKRARGSMIIKASKMATVGGKNAAVEALRPRPFDREDLQTGYAGRYKDGGRLKFSEMTAEYELDDEDLDIIAAGHKKFALTYGIGAVVLLLAGMGFIVFSTSLISIMGGGVLALFFFVFGALAIKSDYAAWQIRMRRFDGFRTYMDQRNSSKPTSTAVIVKP